MIVDRARNPMHPEILEDIVTITMTCDQFRHLSDCVALAYQLVEPGSRMSLISRMMRTEFDRLSSSLEKIVADNAARLQRGQPSRRQGGQSS